VLQQQPAAMLDHVGIEASDCERSKADGNNVEAVCHRAG
jgi:hypothetical protein